MRIWYGQKGWGWRLWGITFGSRIFIGVSLKQNAPLSLFN